MDDRLGLSDAALDSCSIACTNAGEALAGPSRATTSQLHGVTEVGPRVGEFVSALAVACGVLAGAAESIGASAAACKTGSDLVDAGAVAALAGAGTLGGRSAR